MSGSWGKLSNVLMVCPFTVVTSRPEIELTSSRSISQLLNFKNTSDHAISLVRRDSEISVNPMDLLRNYCSCVYLIGTYGAQKVWRYERLVISVHHSHGQAGTRWRKTEACG